MGVASSQFSTSWNLMFMRTKDILRFELEKQEWVQRGLAGGRIEELQAMRATGSLNATTGDGNANKYLNAYTFWTNANRQIFDASRLLLTFSFVVMMVAFTADLSPVIFFGGSWIFFFFLIHSFIMHTSRGMTNIMFSTNIYMAFLISLGVAAFGAFAIYLPLAYGGKLDRTTRMWSTIAIAAFLSLMAAVLATWKRGLLKEQMKLHATSKDIGVNPSNVISTAGQTVS